MVGRFLRIESDRGMLYLRPESVLAIMPNPGGIGSALMVEGFPGLVEIGGVVVDELGRFVAGALDDDLVNLTEAGRNAVDVPR